MACVRTQEHVSPWPQTNQRKLMQGTHCVQVGTVRPQLLYGTEDGCWAAARRSGMSQARTKQRTLHMAAHTAWSFRRDEAVHTKVRTVLACLAGCSEWLDLAACEIGCPANRGICASFHMPSSCIVACSVAHVTRSWGSCTSGCGAATVWPSGRPKRSTRVSWRAAPPTP